MLRFSKPWGSDGWRFRHELLREVAVEVAPPSVRMGLHAKVADALLGVGGERDWRLVAAHYEQAERFNEAATAYQHASASARRRGALTEARRYLTQALGQLDLATPGRDRDRREMALRLERGFLVMTADGQHNRESAADFERCLQLGGTDLRDDELFATLNALTGYYAARADLHRLAQVLEPLRAGLEGRQWFRPAIEVESGVLAWLRGEFNSAQSHFEQATTDMVAADQHEIEAVWFVPSDAIATAHLHLAWTRLVLGDRAGAVAELAQAARCADELDFPQGPYMRDYTTFMECWIHIETGQLDQAAVRRRPHARPERRAARIRYMATAGGNPTRHGPRPGCTRAPRPERAVSVHRDRIVTARQLARDRRECLHHVLRQRAGAAADHGGPA